MTERIPTIGTHRFFLMLATILLLGPAGCGLKEYEERMDLERKKAKLFDYTEDLLGDRLEPPALSDKSAWRFEVFLRVPRGCQRISKGSPVGDPPLYRFPFNQDDKPDSQEKPGWSLYVCCPAATLGTDELRRVVLGVLKKYDLSVDASKKTPDKIELADGEEEIVKVTSKDSLFQIFTHRDGANQIAVVFQTPKDDSTFTPTRDACLKSLDIGEKAVEKMVEFRTRYKPRKS